MRQSHYVFDHYSDECLRGDGVGCDGGECWCPCHDDNAPMFDSNDDVAAWHGK